MKFIHSSGGQAFAGQGCFLYVTRMDGDRIARAVARIEAAAGRIEAAARRPATDAADSELAGKYEALREEAGAALAELDRVIGTLEA